MMLRKTRGMLRSRIPFLLCGSAPQPSSDPPSQEVPSVKEYEALPAAAAATSTFAFTAVPTSRSKDATMEKSRKKRGFDAIMKWCARAQVEKSVVRKLRDTLQSASSTEVDESDIVALSLLLDDIAAADVAATEWVCGSLHSLTCGQSLMALSFVADVLRSRCRIQRSISQLTKRFALPSETSRIADVNETIEEEEENESGTAEKAKEGSSGGSLVDSVSEHASEFPNISNACLASFQESVKGLTESRTALVNAIAALQKHTTGSSKLEFQSIPVLCSCVYALLRCGFAASAVRDAAKRDAETEILTIPPAIMFALCHQMRSDALPRLFAEDAHLAMEVGFSYLVIMDPVTRKSYLSDQDRSLNDVIRLLIAEISKKGDGSLPSPLGSTVEADGVHNHEGDAAEVEGNEPATHTGTQEEESKDAMVCPSMEDCARIMANVAFCRPAWKLMMANYLLCVCRVPKNLATSSAVTHALNILHSLYGQRDQPELTTWVRRVTSQLRVVSNDPLVLAKVASMSAPEDLPRVLELLNVCPFDQLSDKDAHLLLRSLHVRTSTYPAWEHLTAHLLRNVHECITAFAAPNGAAVGDSEANAFSPSTALVSSTLHNITIVANELFRSVEANQYTVDVISPITKPLDFIAQSMVPELIEKCPAATTPSLLWTLAAIQSIRAVYGLDLSCPVLPHRFAESRDAATRSADHMETDRSSSFAHLLQLSLKHQGGAQVTRAVRVAVCLAPFIQDKSVQRKCVEDLVNYNGARTATSVARFVRHIAPLAVVHSIRDAKTLSHMMRWRFLPRTLWTPAAQVEDSLANPFTLFGCTSSTAVRYVSAVCLFVYQSKEWETRSAEMKPLLEGWAGEALRYIAKVSRDAERSQRAHEALASEPESATAGTVLGNVGESIRDADECSGASRSEAVASTPGLSLDSDPVASDGYVDEEHEDCQPSSEQQQQPTTTTTKTTDSHTQSPLNGKPDSTDHFTIPHGEVEELLRVMLVCGLKVGEDAAPIVEKRVMGILHHSGTTEEVLPDEFVAHFIYSSKLHIAVPSPDLRDVESMLKLSPTALILPLINCLLQRQHVALKRASTSSVLAMKSSSLAILNAAFAEVANRVDSSALAGGGLSDGETKSTGFEVDIANIRASPLHAPLSVGRISVSECLKVLLSKLRSTLQIGEEIEESRPPETGKVAQGSTATDSAMELETAGELNAAATAAAEKSPGHSQTDRKTEVDTTMPGQRSGAGDDAQLAEGKKPSSTTLEENEGNLQEKQGAVHEEAAIVEEEDDEEEGCVMVEDTSVKEDIEKHLSRIVCELSAKEVKQVALSRIGTIHTVFPRIAEQLYSRVSNSLDTLSPIELVQLSKRYHPAEDAVAGELKNRNLMLTLDYTEFLRAAQDVSPAVCAVVVEMFLPQLTIGQCARTLSALANKQTSLSYTLFRSLLERVNGELQDVSDTNRGVLLLVLQRCMEGLEQALHASTAVVQELREKVRANLKQDKRMKGANDVRQRKQQKKQHGTHQENASDGAEPPGFLSEGAARNVSILKDIREKESVIADINRRIDDLATSFRSTLVLDTINDPASLQKLLGNCPKLLHALAAPSIVARVKAAIIEPLLNPTAKQDQEDAECSKKSPTVDQSSEAENLDVGEVVEKLQAQASNQVDYKKAPLQQHSLATINATMRILEESNMLTHDVCLRVLRCFVDTRSNAMSSEGDGTGVASHAKPDGYAHIMETCTEQDSIQMLMVTMRFYSSTKNTNSSNTTTTTVSQKPVAARSNAPQEPNAANRAESNEAVQGNEAAPLSPQTVGEDDLLTAIDVYATSFAATDSLINLLQSLAGDRKLSTQSTTIAAALRICKQLLTHCETMTPSQLSRWVSVISKLRIWAAMMECDGQRGDGNQSDDSSPTFTDHIRRLFVQADSHSRCVIIRALATEKRVMSKFEAVAVEVLSGSADILSGEDVEYVLVAARQMNSSSSIEGLVDALGTRMLAILADCKQSAIIRMLDCMAAHRVFDQELAERLLDALDEQCVKGEVRLEAAQVLTLLQACVTMDLFVPERLAIACFRRIEDSLEKLSVAQLSQCLVCIVGLEIGYTASVHAIVTHAADMRDVSRGDKGLQKALELICEEFVVEVLPQMRASIMRKPRGAARTTQYMCQMAELRAQAALPQSNNLAGTTANFVSTKSAPRVHRVLKQKKKKRKHSSKTSKKQTSIQDSA